MKGGAALPLLESEKSTQRNPTQRFVFLPNSLCLRYFPTFQGEKQPEHEEFQGLKAPKRRWIQAWPHGILGEISVFGCLFGPE